MIDNNIILNLKIDHKIKNKYKYKKYKIKILYKNPNDKFFQNKFKFINYM